MKNPRRLFCIALLSAVLPAAAVCAQGKAPATGGKGKLKLQLTTSMPRLRSHAPIPVELDLDWPSEKLLEGRLLLDFFEDERLLGHFDSGELALSTGGQRFRLMLPAMVIHDKISLMTVEARFEGAKRDFDLGKFELRTPYYARRQFTIGVCLPSGQNAIAADFDFPHALRLEQFDADNSRRSELSSFPARFPAGDFPTNALSLYAYDLLLLPAEGLSQLRRKQLDAALRWVAAGGSLCVTIDGPVRAEHVAFLNELARPARNDPIFFRDDAGRISAPEFADAVKTVRFHKGLGRAVVILQPLDTANDLQSAEWRETVAFLWKVRKSQMESIRSGGKWALTVPGEEDFPMPFPFGPLPVGQEQNLSEMLMPDRIKGVPLYAVAIILLLFLLAIAPGDYFLLGYFRRRKYTWILFPVLSLAFTYFTVELARRYMGTTDYRTALVFIDMPDGGRNTQRAAPARVNRIEMLFTATQQVVSSHYRNALYADVDHHRPWIDNTRSMYGYSQTPGGWQYQYYDEDLSMGTKREVPQLPQLPLFSGRMPSVLTVTQPMRQWSPRLSRQSMLKADLPPFDFDWTAVGPRQFASAKGRNLIAESVRRNHPEATVLFFNGEKVFNGKEDPITQHPAMSIGARDRQVVEFVKQLSARPNAGLFEIVSRISPTGNANFEDLALLDTSDENEWLLAIIVPRGDDRFVYRKLYRRGT